jgi:hypothetical protein
MATESGYKRSVNVLLSDNLNLLEREARALECTELVIEADFRDKDFARSDGWPKSNVRPLSPRVVVSMLNSKHGPLRYPCDRFDRFEDNVRAIGLALEALRKVDRYGVTRKGEQYAGWKALPASTNATMTVEAAAALVANLANTKAATILSDAQLARAAFRDALKLVHPDTGGSADRFNEVQTARKVLTAHHGVTL